jgi:hypothetical protein
VKLQKLGKQLRRELKANPKKAGVLALLLAVGLYLWGPLVWGWIAPKSADSGRKTTAANKGTASPAGSAATAGTPSSASATSIATEAGGASSKAKKRTTTGSEFSWQQLTEWIQSDPRTKPAQDLPRMRSPFAPTAKQMAAIQQEKKQQEAKDKPPVAAGKAFTPPPEITPDNANLTVSATIVGPRRRLAVVNGKVIPEGGEIRVPIGRDGRAVSSVGKSTSANSGSAGKALAKPTPQTADTRSSISQTAAASPRSDDGREGSPQFVVFKLLEVRQRSIVLEYKGKQYERKLPVSTLAGIERQ